MKVLSISPKQIVVSLSVDEAKEITNALYERHKNSNPSAEKRRLRSDLIIARDMSEYGHIDDFCVDMVSKIRKGEENNEE